MLTMENTEEKVKAVLSESLDIEVDEIEMNHLLFLNFNIESTEILEITFRLEQEFNFVMGDDEFWNIASKIANEGLYNGTFSDEAIRLIQMNFNISEEVIQGLDSPFSLYNHITVQDLVNYAMSKANNQ